MSQYYFTLASLPAVFYDSEDPMAPEEFLEVCRSTVGMGDYAMIAASALVPQGETQRTLSCVRSWSSWETSLRNALAVVRASKLHLDGDSYLHGDPEFRVDINRAVNEALQAENPSQGEDILNRARWAYLEELEVGHYFDVSRLAIYHLKLQILQRKALMNLENGQRRFDEIYASVSEEGRDVLGQ